MAAAVQVMLGPSAAAVVSIGVLISCYGYLSANFLGFPRILFAMAEQGDMPSVMARVHPRFRTPHVAIVVFAILLYGFSVVGSFQWNVFVSAMARLIYYGSVAVALPVLRRKHQAPDAQFHLPMGWLFAVLAAGTSLLLFPRLDGASLLVLGMLALCVIANCIWASRHTSTTSRQPRA
jgi:amino acid transporter